jgi:hypothetical protein
VVEDVKEIRIAGRNREDTEPFSVEYGCSDILIALALLFNLHTKMYLRFEALTVAVKMSIVVFWVVTPRCLTEDYQM